MCDHKWRYSSARDVFVCVLCWVTQDPDEGGE